MAMTLRTGTASPRTTFRSTRQAVAFVGVSLAAAASYAAAIAIPTAMVANPFFVRMTPPSMWSWLFCIMPALLFGPLAASYVIRLRDPACAVDGKTMGAGVLGYLAVGCPVCNKVVVAVMGISGALTYFQPVQPILGAASVGLLAYGLKLRVFASPTSSAATVGS